MCGPRATDTRSTTGRNDSPCALPAAELQRHHALRQVHRIRRSNRSDWPASHAKHRHPSRAWSESRPRSRVRPRRRPWTGCRQHGDRRERVGHRQGSTRARHRVRRSPPDRQLQSAPLPFRWRKCAPELLHGSVPHRRRTRAARRLRPLPMCGSTRRRSRWTISTTSVQHSDIVKSICTAAPTGHRPDSSIFGSIRSMCGPSLSRVLRPPRRSSHFSSPKPRTTPWAD